MDVVAVKLKLKKKSYIILAYIDHLLSNVITFRPNSHCLTGKKI